MSKLSALLSRVDELKTKLEKYFFSKVSQQKASP